MSADLFGPTMAEDLPIHSAPDGLCSEWCQEHVELAAESSAFPGPFNPWAHQIALLDLPFLPKGPREILFQKSTRVGATKTGLGVAGFAVAKGMNIAIWQPTEADSRSFSRDSIRPLIEQTRPLAALSDSVSKSGRKSLAETLFHHGATLRSWFAAARLMRRVQLHIGYLDELAAYPAPEEGPWFDLARERTADSRGVTIAASTPLTETDHLMMEIEKASMVFDWLHPCQSCGEHFKPDWELVTWDKGDVDSARIHCGHCGAETAIVGGRWLTEDGEGFPAKWPMRVGFRINAMSNPLLTLPDLAHKFELAQGDAEAERAFTNLVLGLPYKSGLRGLTSDKLAARREPLQRPLGVMATMGADVQDDRIEASLWIWPEGNPQALRHFVMHGETADADQGAWPDLAALCREVRPDLILVDVGHHGGAVREFCRRMGAMAAPCRGYSSPPRDGVPARFLSHKINGRTAYLDTSQLKRRIYGWIRGGKVRFGSELEEDYFPGLISEAVKRKRRTNGRMSETWVQVGAFNEPLDCAVYATAAMALLRKAGRPFDRPMQRKRYRDARRAA